MVRRRRSMLRGLCSSLLGSGQTTEGDEKHVAGRARRCFSAFHRGSRASVATVVFVDRGFLNDIYVCDLRCADMAHER
ncbi:hypothetical protein PHLGIDRAFT_202080 [Phlebiopsis gigantea 11061_1 CR5-6]|uniref:Uncharacterized protein n=1 Tax=Phlebiopsis gigantea (strain 11061_1 CR5-6) TaxID=745531 RepID=A0A0C3PFC9_PHLG1|nr:hypothetical protein PHLGIDRAFT_202080 [Phlebiopsis gigantea 11061_1 CR5-6]